MIKYNRAYLLTLKYLLLGKNIKMGCCFDHPGGGGPFFQRSYPIGHGAMGHFKHHNHGFHNSSGHMRHIGHVGHAGHHHHGYGHHGHR